MPQHDWNDDPTTGELWDIDRLERHAHQLALRSGPTPTAARRSVGAHLDRNVRLLREANLVITAALRDGRAITPAAEWLLDNFHIIADQASSIRLNLSTEVWRELPPDIHPDNAGWPRIYCLALDFLAHSDCDFNGDHLARYLTSYQHAAPLTMRELWAVSPVLRLSLLDQLRRFAVRIATALDARGAADAVVDALMTERPALAPGRQLPPLILPAVPHRDAFVVQLSERLGLLGEDGKPMLLQLSGELRSSQTTIDDVIQREHARRSSSNSSTASRRSKHC